MPRLRRLTGSEVIKILEQFGFVVIRSRGSHYRLKLVYGDMTCYTTVPQHGNKPLPPGTLRTIYRQAAVCIPEDDLRPHFYTD